MISQDRVRQLEGFGMVQSAPGYVYRPCTVGQIADCLVLATQSGRQVTLRGGGNSYGDAAIGSENLLLDFTRMNRILEWDPEGGRIRVEPGTTIQDVWEHTIEDGWWLPVVSGTMFVTIGGAVAMNIHGKNNLHAGYFAEHVLAIQVLKTDATLVTVKPEDSAFWAIAGGLGLVGVIVSVTIQLKRISCGLVSVVERVSRDWKGQRSAFENAAGSADYAVSWIDAFAKGAHEGRGVFHEARYAEIEDPASLAVDRQHLPDTIFGRFPKAKVWKYLRTLNSRFGMRFVNYAKNTSSRVLGDDKVVIQSLVEFNFLLDYLPNWKQSYQPFGFIQYQPFLPAESAVSVFSRIVASLQQAKLEPFLAVMKRHRPSSSVLAHGLDGYSLALDIKVRDKERVWNQCQKMNDWVIEAGGRFYCAKDSTMRASDAQASFGKAALEQFRIQREIFDPKGLLTSDLARRLKLP